MLELDGYFNNIVHEGNYVWGAKNDGAIRYNKTDRSYTHYTTENGLPDNITGNNTVLCVTIDKNGLKWFGFPRGIASFNDTTWTAYASEDIYNCRSFNNVTVDHNNIKWFTADDGIVAYNDTSFSFLMY